PWDMAAGCVIAREAGADITDYEGLPHELTSATTIAATPALLAEIHALIGGLSQPMSDGRARLR
ncbi:MAG: inositol monophosphatase family protein, partial [Pseudonocardiaceae bacterium]